MASKALQLALRVWELICTVIVMGLIGNMIATAFAGNPSIVNYDMFVAVFAMLSLFYLIPSSFREEWSFPLGNIVLDGLNCIFWFCAAVAMAAYLRVHSCSNKAYTTSNRITNGAHNTGKRCHEAQASTAFLWFGWAAFTASLVISFLAGRGTANLRGIRRPAMSQVSGA